MKKILAFILTLTLLLSLALSMGAVADAAGFTEKPYYGLGWSEINRVTFPNMENAPYITISANNGVVKMSYNNKVDPAAIASSLKTTMDRLPEGMRHLRIFGTRHAFGAAPEDIVFLDKGVDQMKEQFSAIMKEYHAIGGKLEGIILDTEYYWLNNWEIYINEYYQKNEEGKSVVTNPQIYNQIVANPRYATEIRPMLAERGFTFWENPSGIKSEIYSIWPRQYLSSAELEKYGDCQSIWNTVMSIRMAQYLNESIYEPAVAYYPDVLLSDYETCDSATWQTFSPTSKGVGTNGMKAGNVSNNFTLLNSPAASFFVKDGTYLYQKPYGYNDAVFEDDPYNMFTWDVNRFKNMYAATDTEKISIWLCAYDYVKRAGSVASTPYYAESILHFGLLNPQPFLVYVYKGDYTGSTGDQEYNKRIQVISEILNELTRVAGFSDRKPIKTPVVWNDGFMLSGMYTGGRNLWRITPDTTDGMTVEAFKVKDKDPTFSINGTTITFPQGKIIADGQVSVVGTSGYWVETPKDVQPVITRDADHYSKYPSYMEDFNSYTAGTSFTASTAALPQTWKVEKTKNLLIENGALALTGTASVSNIKLPKNITAGDTYAKQQAWEVSFALPSDLNAAASVKLLACGADGGFMLKGTGVYYDEKGAYKQLDGVTLTAGQKYTLRREVDFTTSGAFKSTYSIYANGSLLKQAANVPMKSVILPVSEISISCGDLTGKVLIDDFKLYPTCFATDFKLYDSKFGRPLTGTGNTDKEGVAYRLSWMNATSESKKVNVRVARYNSSGSLVADDIVKTLSMEPGCDGLETGIVKNTTGKIRVYLEELSGYTPPDHTTSTTTSTTASTTAPATAPTDASTTAPTTAPTTEPTGASTTAPTTVPTATTQDTQPSNPTESSTLPTTGENSEKGSGAVVLTVVLVLVAAGVIAGVCFVIYRKKNGKETA